VAIRYDPDLGRPVAAPLERCAELLGVDLATIRKAAATPDLGCADVNGRNFTVLAPDPHGFDREGDGLGCES
jgi:hypothetical protein